MKTSSLRCQALLALALAVIGKTTLLAVVVSAPFVMAQPITVAAERIAFTADGRTYMGQHVADDQVLSVEIDGFQYRGHYQQHGVSANPVLAEAPVQGIWGQAFLFASSAQVMRCQLSQGFPDVRGTCRDTDGRTFTLTSSDSPGRP